MAEVEVLGRLAFYAVSSVPEETSWALAGLIEHDHAALAGLAVAAVWIPHRSLRTDIAFLAVEVRSLFGAIHALLLDNAVDLIMRADLAYLFCEIKIVRMVTFDTDSTIEEQSIVFALTGVCFWFVDSADAAGLAGKSSMVVEGFLLTDCAFLPVEEWFFIGAEDALVQVEVINSM